MISDSATTLLSRPSIRILVVEDDNILQSLLGRTVENLGYSVLTCTTAEQALDVFASESIALVLMDIVLPGMDGFELCQILRAVSDVPIIAITSLTGAEDIVHMLELGADDYVTKPFSFDVLEVRIEAQLRQVSSAPQRSSIGVLKAGNLVLNSSKRVAKIGQTEIELTERECSLLRCLMSEPGIPIPISRIYEYVWGQCNGQEKTMVPTVIQRLRSKLEADPVSPSVIVNVRGYGYKFAKPS